MDVQKHPAFLSDLSSALRLFAELTVVPGDIRGTFLQCATDLQELRLDRMSSFREDFRKLTWKYNWNTDAGYIASVGMMLLSGLEDLCTEPRVFAPTFRFPSGRVHHAVKGSETVCCRPVPANTLPNEEGIVTCKACIMNL